MRLVELRQLEAILQSLSESTDVTIQCNTGRLDIVGRNSPYASNTEVKFDPTFWNNDALGRFEIRTHDDETTRGMPPPTSGELRNVVLIENDRYGLLLNAKARWFGKPRRGYEHLEVAGGVLPVCAITEILHSIPGAYLLGIDFTLPAVQVAWSRPRVMGWWPNGDPIFAAELTGDLESLRGHRMTHLRFRDDRPTITLPDETEFVVHAYSIVNFHVLAYGENEGERTLALLPVEGLDTVPLHGYGPCDASSEYDPVATWRGLESHLQLEGVKTWNLP